MFLGGLIMSKGDRELYHKVDALESRASKIEQKLTKIENKLRDLCRAQGIFY